jgi:hypothetical protein
MTQLICALFLLPALGVASAHALTVEEILRLKKAGVADSTIELLIEKNAEQDRRTGIIRRDGWIVHTTDTREPQAVDNYGYETSYPIDVYPWVGGRGAGNKGGARRAVPLGR